MPLDFQRDGYITVTGLLDPEGVLAAHDDLEHCRMRLKLDAGASIIAVQPGPAAVAAEPLVRVAQRVLEGPVEAFGYTYVSKPPGSGLPVLWHQDGHPWADRLQGAPACSVWVALDDSNAANGCLRVIPGSHTLGARPLIPATNTPNLFEVRTDPELVDEDSAEDLVLDAGDACVHHPALIHGSGPNRSDRPRRALVVRYRRLVAKTGEC